MTEKREADRVVVPPDGGVRPMQTPMRRRAADPIASGLKRLWTDIENEPVPDEFFSLLDSIEERRSDAGGDR